MPGTGITERKAVNGFMEEKKLDFENNISMLEKIVEKLEGGDISLDESLKLFEQGVKMIAECNKALDDAEQKVNILLSGKDGSVQESPFDGE